MTIKIKRHGSTVPHHSVYFEENNREEMSNYCIHNNIQPELSSSHLLKALVFMLPQFRSVLPSTNSSVRNSEGLSSQMLLSSVGHTSGPLWSLMFILFTLTKSKKWLKMQPVGNKHKHLLFARPLLFLSWVGVLIKTNPCVANLIQKFVEILAQKYFTNL